MHARWDLNQGSLQAKTCNGCFPLQGSRQPETYGDKMHYHPRIWNHNLQHLETSERKAQELRLCIFDHSHRPHVKEMDVCAVVQHDVCPYHYSPWWKMMSFHYVSWFKMCSKFSPYHYLMRISTQTKSGLAIEYHIGPFSHIPNVDVSNSSLNKRVSVQIWGEWKLLVFWHTGQHNWVSCKQFISKFIFLWRLWVPNPVLWQYLPLWCRALIARYQSW